MTKRRSGNSIRNADDIATELRRRLRHYIPGSRLPGRKELARHLGITEYALAKVLDRLAESGLIERRERGGVFVPALPSPPTIRQVRVLSDRRRQSLFHETALLGISQRCAHYRLKMHLDHDPPELTGVEPLRRLAGGDPCEVGWIVLLRQVPENLVLAEWLSRGVPFVVLDGHPDTVRVNLVARDMQRTLCQATETLIGAGHRRIACTGISPSMTHIARQRLAGFQLAHDQHNLTFDPTFIIQGRHQTDATEDGLARLLALPNRPTGIVAVDQEFGCRAILVCERAGLEVPGDVSVISTGTRAMIGPAQLHRLSCFDEGDPGHMGRLAVDLLAEPNSQGDTTTIWLGAVYVDRGSVGPPRVATPC